MIGAKAIAARASKSMTSVKRKLSRSFSIFLLIVEDVSHSVRESRLQALGRTDAGRLLHISFTLRGDGRLIRVISARTMHRKERLRYEHEA